MKNWVRESERATERERETVEGKQEVPKWKHGRLPSFIFKCYLLKLGVLFAEIAKVTILVFLLLSTS